MPTKPTRKKPQSRKIDQVRLTDHELHTVPRDYLGIQSRRDAALVMQWVELALSNLRAIYRSRLSDPTASQLRAELAGIVRPAESLLRRISAGTLTPWAESALWRSGHLDEFRTMLKSIVKNAENADFAPAICGSSHVSEQNKRSAALKKSLREELAKLFSNHAMPTHVGKPKWAREFIDWGLGKITAP